MNIFNGIATIFIISLEVMLISCETNKPTGMKQGIYCECCSATVKEISKKLEKKTSDPWDVRVIEAMENVCHASSFRAYTYSPPTSVKACRYLMENYEEDMEQIFGRKASDPEQEICYKLTKACEGVDRSKPEKEDVNVNVNGETAQQNDGVNRLNVDINDPNSAARLAEQIKQQMAMQQQMGSDEGDDDDEPEEGESDDGGENLLKAYDENGNEVKEEDLPEDEPKKDENKSEEKKEESNKEKTEL